METRRGAGGMGAIIGRATKKGSKMGRLMAVTRLGKGGDDEKLKKN